MTRPNPRQPSWIALVTSILATAGAAFAYLDGRQTNTGAKGALATQETVMIELIQRVTRLETLYEVEVDRDEGPPEPIHARPEPVPTTPENLDRVEPEDIAAGTPRAEDELEDFMQQVDQRMVQQRAAQYKW